MKKVAILVENFYEELELWYPKYRLEEGGFKTILVAPDKNKTYTGKHGYPCKPDASIDDLDVKQFAGVVIPGGYAPDHMRRNEKMVQFVKEMDQQKKMIAAICHAGWMLCSAKIAKGRKLTSFSGIRIDMENAGAHWVDKELVVDRNLITSRKPDDLPYFGKAIVDWLI